MNSLCQQDTPDFFHSFLSALLEDVSVVYNTFLPTDALLKKAFATPSFQGYNFVSSLLVLLGLLKVHLNCAHSAKFAAAQKCVFRHCLSSCIFCFLEFPSSAYLTIVFPLHSIVFNTPPVGCPLLLPSHPSVRSSWRLRARTR